VFCCQGCLFVHDLLAENGLQQFYDLNEHPGARVRAARDGAQWDYLDNPAVSQGLLDFSDGKTARVTFQVPAIHCVACVWLLENLFRLHPGVGKSRVNFGRRELAIQFDLTRLPLSQLVKLLASIGYEPQLTLGELEREKPGLAKKKQWLQVGIAGFGFGNIMLLSLPLYLGLDSASGPFFQVIFGSCSLLLALPVVIYSASDYWRSALLACRRRALTLEVPIALGLAAIYAQSAYEIISGRGAGYLDSLCGLIFFLLCGRVFQQKTQERMAFDRDYKCFFPLAATRKTAGGEESVAISLLKLGDRLVLRQGELIPADARLIAGEALIDYSFVTGESEPVARKAGDYLYAGGQHIGPLIEVEILKPVSQSYLTSLWGHEAFHKARENTLDTLTNRYSRRFTRIVIAVAVLAAIGWIMAGDPARAIKAFTSVLIVACPCALALAAPFTLGTAQRLLARLQVFLKNTLVLERMAETEEIIFDKTGTLTASGGGEPSFCSHAARELSPEELGLAGALARQSVHPLSGRIARFANGPAALEVADFEETAGCGIRGKINGTAIQLGSRDWLSRTGVTVPEMPVAAGSTVWLAIGDTCRGAFVLPNALRANTDRLLDRLASRYEIGLLSGDNTREQEHFSALFPRGARLHFNQSPMDKLGFIRDRQKGGRTVMMVGDGLNDAGALKQSDVGVAVIERSGAFSPASDVILSAGQVSRLADILAFSKKSARIVRLSFGISAFYNALGISIAAAGVLSPLICAILMPLSSFSVVLFACSATTREARKLGLSGGTNHEQAA